MTKSTRRMARRPSLNSTIATPPSSAAIQSAAQKAKTGTKIVTVIALLQRGEGASLEEIATVTDWQKHTIRASLTGLKKKGHAIEKTKRGDTTCYRIVAEA